MGEELGTCRRRWQTASLALFLALLGGLVCLAGIPAAYASQTESPISFLPVAAVAEFPDAVAPSALQYACSEDENGLGPFFESKGLPFEPRLVKRHDRKACHIYYEPTVPGFRASPDDGTVRRLFATVDPISLAARRKPVGDSLSILTSVLAHASRPLDVTVSTHEEFRPEFWSDVREMQFPGTPHSLELEVHPGPKEYPWAQDFMKPGEAGGRPAILVTRRLFEGRAADGEKFRPFLDSLSRSPFVRSKLSWEGGDLQFASDPEEAGRLILFYGKSARDYWGAGGLTRGEFEYVLRAEFGADSTVDLSAFGQHVDFLVSFLPADRIALVASEERENHALAKAAARALAALYGARAPGELQELEQILADPHNVTTADRAAAIRLLQQLLRILPRIPPPEDASFEAEFREFSKRHCPVPVESCLSAEGTLALSRVNPGLVKRKTDAAAEQALRAVLTPRLLVLINSQLSRERKWKQDLLDAKAEEIGRLGFRVVRAPYLFAPDNLHVWAGVSYVNLLVLDRTLFVPTFGLGEPERKILSDLAEEVGGAYRVAPVDARFNVAFNGGVHCTFSAVRDLPHSD